MSFIRWRQKIINRISPQNSNRRYLVTHNKAGAIEPIPDRKPFDYDFTGLNQSGYGTHNLEIDLRVPGKLHLQLLNYDWDQCPTNKHIISGAAFLLYLNGGFLAAQANGVDINICPYIEVGQCRFHTVEIEWSPSATPGQTDMAFFVDGVQKMATNFPTPANKTITGYIANAAALNNSFQGILRNLFITTEPGNPSFKNIAGYRFDEGSGLVLTKMGEGVGTDGSLTPATSGQAWYSNNVGVAVVTPGSSAGTISYFYVDSVPEDGVLNVNITNIQGWYVEIAGVPVAVQSVFYGTPNYMGVIIAATAHAPGATYLLRYLKANAVDKTNLANFPSFQKTGVLP